MDPETELASARELLEEATIRLDGAADPDEDQEWLDEYGPQMEDYRAVACVAYRARRTRVWLRCQSLLATYVASLEAAGVGSDEYVAEKERRKAEGREGEEGEGGGKDWGGGRRRRTGADVAPDISPRLPLHAHLHDDLAPRREARAA